MTERRQDTEDKDKEGKTPAERDASVEAVEEEENTGGPRTEDE